MRLRTLPVSASGVLLAIGIAVWQNHFRWIPAILCLVFALMAQVVSNFANEYYDYRRGADKKGRVGPRRGVTEGDMGIMIAVFALAYSAGPYPLSYHGLGELTVFLFYGMVPVIFSYYVIAGRMDALAVLGGITIGFMGVNVLLVNNYRDMDDDIDAGKRTAVVIFGRKLAAAAYLFNGFMAIAMLSPLWLMIYLNHCLSHWVYLVPLLYLVMHTVTWIKLNRSTGAALNPLLGATARNMLIFTVLMLLFFVI